MMVKIGAFVAALADAADRLLWCRWRIVLAEGEVKLCIEGGSITLSGALIQNGGWRGAGNWRVEAEDAVMRLAESVAVSEDDLVEGFRHLAEARDPDGRPRPLRGRPWR